MSKYSPFLSSNIKPILQIPPIPETFEAMKEESCITPKANPVSIPKKCCASGCKKKLSLTDFPCKCGKICCPLHRAAEEHACSYDYKADHNKLLKDTIGTAVIAKKIDII
jgi:hypothetical protein